MFKHLLVPLDGSKLAEKALPLAIELAQAFQSRITLFSATRPPYMAVDAGGTTYTEMLVDLGDQMRDETEAYLRDHQAHLQDAGLRADFVTDEGDTIAELILEAAERLGVDTIVMSTHGRGGVRRWVFGSVADRVLQQARVPVLLVRVGEEDRD